MVDSGWTQDWTQIGAIGIGLKSGYVDLNAALHPRLIIKQLFFPSNTVGQRPAAIVTPSAGTTRDVIESAVNLGGYPVLFGDTAGMREAQDEVEQEGVRRATER